MENIYKRAIINSNKVVEYMQDDLSRDIYMARVMNSLTYDYNYITRITVDNIDVMDKLRKDIESYIREGRKLILDGAGYYGKSIKMTLKDVKFECFSDRNSQEKMIMGICAFKERSGRKISGCIIYSRFNGLCQTNKNGIKAAWR